SLDEVEADFPVVTSERDSDFKRDAQVESLRSSFRELFPSAFNDLPFRPYADSINYCLTKIIDEIDRTISEPSVQVSITSLELDWVDANPAHESRTVITAAEVV